MATGNKFNAFPTALAAGTHAGCINADTDVLRVYLTNLAPSASADVLKADLAEIATGNGYSGAVDIQNVRSMSGSIITVDGTDFTITATGTIATFRYAVLYNDTAANDPLIAWWDHGLAVTLLVTQTWTFTIPSTGLFRVGGP